MTGEAPRAAHRGGLAEQKHLGILLDWKGQKKVCETSCGSELGEESRNKLVLRHELIVISVEIGNPITRADMSSVLLVVVPFGVSNGSALSTFPRASEFGTFALMCDLVGTAGGVGALKVPSFCSNKKCHPNYQNLAKLAAGQALKHRNATSSVPQNVTEWVCDC